MGTVFTELDEKHKAFIRKQHMFFVSTAPLEEDGHINLSPKGYDSFRILSSSEVVYLDVTGSGNETSAHVQQNGRITMMFIAFEGAPMILRLYGQGQVILPDTHKWNELIQHFEVLPGTRQMIYTRITDVKASCGYSIPFYKYEGERETLNKWALNKDEQQLAHYHLTKNASSMDGLPTPIGARKKE